MKCKHVFRVIKREGKKDNENYKIFLKCTICGSESILMPNFLRDIFSIPVERKGIRRRKI